MKGVGPLAMGEPRGTCKEGTTSLVLLLTMPDQLLTLRILGSIFSPAGLIHTILSFDPFIMMVGLSSSNVPSCLSYIFRVLSPDTFECELYLIYSPSSVSCQLSGLNQYVACYESSQERCLSFSA
jgi:hypothetical protein